MALQRLVIVSNWFFDKFELSRAGLPRASNYQTETANGSLQSYVMELYNLCQARITVQRAQVRETVQLAFSVGTRETCVKHGKPYSPYQVRETEQLASRVGNLTTCVKPRKMRKI